MRYKHLTLLLLILGVWAEKPRQRRSVFDLITYTNKDSDSAIDYRTLKHRILNVRKRKVRAKALLKAKFKSKMQQKLKKKTNILFNILYLRKL